jgi:TRAP-type C4-dicarboxylate transport system substrate-binding protein
MSDSTHRKAAGLVAWAVTTVLAIVPATGAAADTLTLSTLAERGSEAHQAAERLAERIAEATDRRVQIQVRPASELGDWPEVHEGVVYGAVDLALQPRRHSSTSAWLSPGFRTQCRIMPRRGKPLPTADTSSRS